ncbi:hypothetical protein CEXT_709971 [Caerostris extrusa]|uniref:Uncharacterized protein n=1 Tax=Caerostris extrusa TaxID=172846 RepID=A0AAV4VUD7_CAEEX|nr:hypothetical protein CEXT_709971 [Caerostris extrusa]
MIISSETQRKYDLLLNWFDMLPNSAKRAKKNCTSPPMDNSSSDQTRQVGEISVSIFGSVAMDLSNEFVPGRPTSRNQLIETTTLRYARSSMPTDVAICARL